MSVTELLAAPGGPGRPLPLSAGSERARLGQALHAAWRAQEEAQAGGDGIAALRAEVPVRTELEHAGWRVELHGRVDAVRDRPDGGLAVEELKTLPAWPPTPPTAARARRQASLYAWMLALETGSAVTACVLWWVLDEARPRREEVALDPAAVEDALRRDLAGWIRSAEAQHAARAARRALAPRLPFPHARPRPAQRALAGAVERALAEGEQLLLEAPTGAGKTAAVLHGALRAALAASRRLVVLTPTSLVARSWARTLRLLGPAAGIPLGVQLRGKATVCLQTRPLCHPAACPAAADLAVRLEAPELLGRAFDDRQVLLPERARTLGEAATLCPFELLRRAAAEAPVRIADWNHAFHPRAALPELAGDDARGDVWIVDEIHHLPDRLREAGSATLDAGALEEAAGRLALRGAPRHDAQRALLRELAAQVESAAEEAGLPPGPGEPELEQALPLDALAAMREPMAREVGREIAAEAGLGPDPTSPFLDAAFALEDLLAAGARAGSVGLVGRRGGAARLRAILPDPAALAREALGRPHAVIGLSATLPPTGLLADLLGLDGRRLAEHRVPAGPSGGRRRLVIDPGIDTTARARPRATRALAARLAALAAAVPGHTLAVLPGFAWLEEVRAALPASGRPVRAQRRDDDASARRELLEALEDAAPTLVLAVAGGVLAEGVDVAPGRLRAVAVVGPCVPPPDAERRVFERLCEERFGEGFLFAYAVPGMQRVVQAAGRLLRGDGDRGVVALLGRRFLRDPYRGLLPAAWLEGEAPEAFVGDAADAASVFFAAGDGAAAAAASRSR